jgi:hypothetical protein
VAVLRPLLRVSLLVASVALLSAGAAACGGDGNDDEGGTGTNGAAGGGGEATVEIDPTSGPPGTEIEWTLEGCDEDADKSVGMYIGTPTDPEPGKEVVSSPETKDSSGSITVPEDVTKGPLTLSVLCLSDSEPEGGVLTIDTELARAQFELTP